MSQDKKIKPSDLMMEDMAIGEEYILPRDSIGSIPSIRQVASTINRIKGWRILVSAPLGSESVSIRREA